MFKCHNCGNMFDNRATMICTQCGFLNYVGIPGKGNKAGIPEFHALLDQMGELHARKNADYASKSNPFSNFDFTTYVLRNFTNPRDQAFVWPIATKLARLAALLNSTEPPQNESISDSLIDIANYSLLWAIDIGKRRMKL